MNRITLPLWLEITAAIVLTVVVSNLITIAAFRIDGERRFAGAAADMQSGRFAATVGAVLRAPEEVRSRVAEALSMPNQTVSIDAAALVAADAPREREAEAQLLAMLPAGSRGEIRVALTERHSRAGVTVSVAMSDGRWVNGRFAFRWPGPPLWPTLTAGGAALIALVFAALWLDRRIARPLDDLAVASVALRRGELRAVSESGPAPVREASRAFNTMSAHVMSLLKGQRAMMAAVAHDLRTPISALRFRVEAVDDAETRERLLKTIDEMQAMTDAALEAMRSDGLSEQARSLDLGALAESVCADMADIGGDIVYEGDGAFTCVCRAGEVRRALRNLIENALRYGARARVRPSLEGETVAVHIDDDGPGIPPDQIERVFEPFARLEESRNASTGGYGLGLSITRLIARGHGGDVLLSNRKEGGLRASFILPRS